jgi:outer membrane protein assembly factor BamB
MLNKFFPILFISIFLFACSGEKYDISNAFSILPERKEVFYPETGLANERINYSKSEVYLGNFEEEKLFKLSGIISNFIINEGRVYFVNKNFHLIGINLETKKEEFNMALISSRIKLKKKNITFTTLVINGDDALITLNNGYIVAVNISEKNLLWQTEISDVILSFPFIYKDKALISTSSGAFYSFNINDGKEIYKTESYDDALGTNFSLNVGLKPVFFPASNMLMVYYRSDIFFVDIKSGNRVFTLPLVDGSLEFAKISGEPTLTSKNIILAGTSRNIMAFSLMHGVKLWNYNANIVSNILDLGNYVVVADASTSRIIAFNILSGGVKWISPLSEKHKGKIRFIAGLDNQLFSFDEKGVLTKFNIQSGELQEIMNKKYYAKNLDYLLWEGKIYYIDSSNNLILLN